MKERVFRFKHFSVAHSRSAMKVGVDGVLVGAWAGVEGKNFLDVGCGCGLIALMLLQRNSGALVEAIDIDRESVEEARENGEASPWGDRLTVTESSFDCYLDHASPGSFDLIVSNPPFYDSGVADPATPRELSRHEGSLSPKTLATRSSRLLKEGGRLALIAPAESADEIRRRGEENGLTVARICYVRDNPTARVKRVLMEFRKTEANGLSECHDTGEELRTLTLFDRPGEPTEEYREMCKDFYLKF